LPAGHRSLQFVGIGTIDFYGFDVAQAIEGGWVDIADEHVEIAAAREKVRDRASDLARAQQQHLMHEMTPKVLIDNIDKKALEVNYRWTKGFAV
jgi:F0F1-type ATP synthase epsilon subunit